MTSSRKPVHALAGQTVVECRYPRRKHSPAACLATRASRFEASWLLRPGDESSRVTMMVSAGELSGVYDMAPAGLIIKALEGSHADPESLRDLAPTPKRKR